MKVQVYEWLRRGEGDNRINVDIPLSSPVSIKSSEYGGGVLIFRENPKELGYIGNFDNIGLRCGYNNPTETFVASDVAEEYVITTDTLNGVRMPRAMMRLVKIFGSATTQNHAKIGYVKTDTLHLKPCKLLTPYGTHPIGECCMIDINTNTLYFNQGTGAFSVEGEALEIIDTTPCYNQIISPMSTKAARLREWLKSDGYASIILNNDFSKPFSAEFSAEGNVNQNTWIIGTFVNNDIRVWNGNRIYLYTSNDASAAKIGFNYDGSVVKIVQKESGIEMTCNGETKTIINKFATNNGETCLFGLKPHDGLIQRPISNVRFKYFKTGTLDLHPAELALPYDNHPIGEACMIDLNSGDLYFNQGSGQFTCEGAFLGYWQDKPMTEHYCDVEGSLHKSVQIFADAGDRLRLIWEKNVPWEGHRWLEYSEIGASLVVPSFNNFLLICKAEKTELTSHPRILSQNINNGVVVQTENSVVNYYVDASMQGQVKVSDMNYIKIQQRDGVVSLDDKLIDKWTALTNISEIMLRGMNGVPPHGIGIHILQTDTLHLFPAILDRPTLAEEDNNGIARKQGEAVFVDEARYKQGLPWVFGNVASSGSFSVSDYLPPRKAFINALSNDPLMVYNPNTGGFRYLKSNDYTVWNKPTRLRVVLSEGKYFVRCWAEKIDNQTSLISWEGVRLYSPAGDMLLELIEGRQEPLGHAEEKILIVDSEMQIDIAFKTGLNYEGYLAIERAEDWE